MVFVTDVPAIKAKVIWPFFTTLSSLVFPLKLTISEFLNLLSLICVATALSGSPGPSVAKLCEVCEENEECSQKASCEV